MTDDRQIEIFKKAYNIIASYPEVAYEIAQISPKTLEILGCTLEELRLDIIHRYINNLTNIKGIDSFEFLLRLGCENENEYREMKEEHLRNIAKAIGITYEEMVSENNIK